MFQQHRVLLQSAEYIAVNSVNPLLGFRCDALCRLAQRRNPLLQFTIEMFSCLRAQIGNALVCRFRRAFLCLSAADSTALESAFVPDLPALSVDALASRLAHCGRTVSCCCAAPAVAFSLS
jgi:hypothetical protein